ncbi:ABC transporter substrate-binding protein [Candidatus Enterococcus clewellii]|uniref:Oligogalacturonide transport system substrate-binding protein n=1 Tax=Candidatus Enterococcus clewellii TaxID=1834193 RepID=A0A242JX27_9ENTE|nr:sugar ABC transporter substrate-binding protein [Enterococcus sp. 9E7_DIV0242]OTP09868.1 hypothetical protein A5888_004064 [Enterococcus sp. 9E7_DIV0242]
MKFKKMFTVLGVISLSVALLAACGKKEAASGGTEEIRISWWGGDSRNEAVQEAIKKFEEENPKIKVKAEFGGYAGYQEKITTQLSGGTAPDVIRLDSMWLDQYQNQLTDINELGDDIGLDNFNKESLEPVSINGKLLGLPLSTNYRTLYYNKTVLDEYGIEPPESWEDLIAMREKLPEDVYPVWSGFSTKYVTPLVFFSILAQQTGKPLADENNKLLYTEKEFKNALQFYADLVEQKVITSKKLIDNSGMVDGAPAPPLVEGKWVTFFEFTANINTINNQLAESGYEMAMAGFPSMEGEKSTGVWTKPSMVYAIPESSKKKEAAAKLIDYLMNSEEANKIQKLENGVPDSQSGKATLEAEDLITPMVTETIALGEEKVDTSLNTMFKWDRARLNDMAADVITQLDYEKISVEEAAAQFYKAFKEEEATFTE